MAEMTIKVGDVVAWADVPDGTLARYGDGCYFLRLGNLDTDRLVRDWTWSTQDWDRVTIIAMGLTGHETAEDLRRLAEVFEVREALTAVGGPAELAERIHAAGWRPGDTAERAALLLRMHELVQVGEGDEAIHRPAWEVARDLVDCPQCDAPAGANCCGVFDDGGLGELENEVCAARLDAATARGE